MIYLEQTVNQILREEGQVIVSLEDLQITWEDLENLFIGVYEQSKQYISIYDWTQDFIGLSPEQKDFSHIRHLTYNAYFQRMMPDLPSYTWEFNPYTKNASSMVNTTFGIEVGKYPTLEQLQFSIPLNLKENRKQVFMLPCSFRPEDFTFGDMQAFPILPVITVNIVNSIFISVILEQVVRMATPRDILHHVFFRSYVHRRIPHHMHRTSEPRKNPILCQGTHNKQQTN